MSKILTQEEAQAIVKMMLEPLGYNVPVFRYKPGANSPFQLCNTYTTTTGYLWWKKKVERFNNDPLYSGLSWEDIIDQLDHWIETTVKTRLVLAEKFRDKYAIEEANKALDDELRR